MKCSGPKCGAKFNRYLTGSVLIKRGDGSKAWFCPDCARKKLPKWKRPIFPVRKKKQAPDGISELVDKMLLELDDATFIS